MVKLSKRMGAVASLVTAGNRLADIGTDHGYVPIALIQNGIIPSAIAMDINAGPLERANEHIAQNQLGEVITTRLSDGVAALKPNEADTILIAGMGGELVIHILEEGKEVCRSAKEIILQPQSEIAKVRKYLRDNGYQTEDEDMIFEEGKYYPMMKVVPVERDDSWENLNEQTIETCDRYGRLLLRDGHCVLKKYLVKEYRQLTQIKEQLQKREQTEPIVNRLQEIEEDLKYNESAYSILGAIKECKNNVVMSIR